jgi:thioredoxin 2
MALLLRTVKVMADDNLKTYSICTECNQVNRVLLVSPENKTPVCGKCKAALHFHDGMTALNSTSIALLSQKIPVPLIVDFWASWCRPCHVFAPTFKQAAQILAGKAVFAKVNVEANPLASDFYHIQGIPTLMILKNGLELSRQSGAMPLETFLSWIDGVVPVKAAA